MNLEQVVQRAKRDIELKYVYVMMPIPQLETLLSGLEELKRENDALETKYHVDMNNYRSQVQTWQEQHDKQIVKLRSEQANMKEALEWYGDMEHYTVLPGAQLTGTEKDMGYRARKVLSTLTQEESA